MSNLVLYRKYRPRSFSDIIGQEHVIQTLKNAIANNKTSHGYLFTGPHGCGKTTIARIFAKAMNCENRKEGESEPCNKCNSCKQINEEGAMDLIEIDAASNRGIDEIRELKEGIGFVPVRAKYKVFIIDEAHQLTGAAANALLKTLEEPPSHAIFILATTEAHKMIPTIISRCQRFDFRKLKTEEIISRLSKIMDKEKIKYDKETLNLIALAANGSERDAETLLDQVVSFSGKKNKIEKQMVEKLLGMADRSVIFKMISYLSEKKEKQAIEFLNDLIYKGVDIEEFNKSLIQYLRQILLFQVDPNFKSPLAASLSKENKEKLQNLSKKLERKEIINIIDELTEVEEKQRYASIPQLPLELAIVEICGER